MAKLVPLSVLYATSLDTDHPPSHSIDENDGTFWLTTGLYPQEIAYQFKEPCQIMRIAVITGKVKNMTLFEATNQDCTEWSEIDEFSFQALPIKQLDTHQVNMQSTAYGVKVSINQGWGPFSALYSLSIEGPIVHEN